MQAGYTYRVLFIAIAVGEKPHVCFSTESIPFLHGVNSCFSIKYLWWGTVPPQMNG
jgi:hypothetical protein